MTTQYRAALQRVARTAESIHESKTQLEVEFGMFVNTQLVPDFGRVSFTVASWVMEIDGGQT